MSKNHELIKAEASRLAEHAERLSRFVLHLNAIESVDYWVVQVPLGFAAEVRQAIGKLPDTVSRKDVPQLAWIGRNALELHIWARYVERSPEFAKRFLQDAYVDAIEVLKLMNKVVKQVPEAYGEKLNNAASSAELQLAPILVRDKVGLTLRELKTRKHLSVAEVAKEVGYGNVYSIWNPLLSKLVHSTAFNVLVAADNMDSVGSNTFNFVVSELRSVLEYVNIYLEKNQLPTFNPLF